MRVVEFLRDHGPHRKGERITVLDEGLFAALLATGVAVERPIAEAPPDKSVLLVRRTAPARRASSNRLYSLPGVRR